MDPDGTGWRERDRGGWLRILNGSAVASVQRTVKVRRGEDIGTINSRECSKGTRKKRIDMTI